MTGQAASALGNISGPAWVMYTAAALAAIGLLTQAAVTIGAVLRDIAVTAVQLARATIRCRKLGDAIAKADRAQQATRAMNLGDLVIHREQETYAAFQASRLRATSTDLTARPRCTWCWPKDGDLVPSPAECPCITDCQSVACIAPLRDAGFPS